MSVDAVKEYLMSWTEFEEVHEVAVSLSKALAAVPTPELAAPPAIPILSQQSESRNCTSIS
jgi:hypothetical protein